MNKFWMCHVDGTNGMNTRHDSLAKARAEALLK